MSALNSSLLGFMAELWSYIQEIKNKYNIMGSKLRNIKDGENPLKWLTYSKNHCTASFAVLQLNIITNQRFTFN